jgi:hypothetical protein
VAGGVIVDCGAKKGGKAKAGQDVFESEEMSVFEQVRVVLMLAQQLVSKQA